jgi:signal transduction histidine kinase
MRTARLQALGEEMLNDAHRFSPAALHLLRSLARENGLNDLAARVKHAVDRAEVGERFQKAYERTEGMTAGKWLAWGEPLYLTGFAPTARKGDLAFRAVPVSEVPTRIPVSLTRGTLLGDPFVSLRAELPPARFEPQGLGRPLLLTLLGLTLLIALLGGLLLWRDVRREMELAGLRTRFIASVSHELRTPLAAVRMFIESLKMNPDIDHQTRLEYLDTMLRETERLSRLVNNVLEFSRIERNQRTYSLRQVCLPDLASSVIASFRPMLDQAGFRLQAEIAPAVPEVRADPDAIEQAILNLLSNAVKYSGDSREIQVKLLRNGDAAEIQVRDFGSGIPASEQERIFESFYRVPTNENSGIQGAGLGLTLVRHVMEGHGGKVLVDSSPGLGSTFRLVLPFA